MNRTTIPTAVLSICLLCLGHVPQAQSCTSIMVGRKASADGSVMTSHTCDSHHTGSQIVVVPRLKHPRDSQLVLSKRQEDNNGAMPRFGFLPTGSIPQVPVTFGYLMPAYAAMNERQLAIGESTFGGRLELRSEKGLIDCVMLTRLMLERAATAREAIQLGGKLMEKYGWCDHGEALTIADPQEVWLMEIVGPGKDAVGAIWAAQRVPDDQVSIVANAARIGAIDLAQTDFFMASSNVMRYAQQQGYWNPNDAQPFRFYAAYNPKGRESVGSTRREWRVLSLLAPSLELHPNRDVFPFSVKPDALVKPETVMNIFRDTYEGTDFDTTKNLTVTGENGKTVKSPLANPFMPYEMNQLLKINGGWSWRGERTLARWYCMYVTVTQSRAWLPDQVGGIVWFGYGNPATTTYAPLYAGITEMPQEYKTDGRTTGFSRTSAWWAFNRVATLAAHRWGEMRVDVANRRDPLQQKYLGVQKTVDAEASNLVEKNPEQARAFLTGKSLKACREITLAYWDLGDLLWTKYDEKW